MSESTFLSKGAPIMLSLCARFWELGALVVLIALTVMKLLAGG